MKVNKKLVAKIGLIVTLLNIGGLISNFFLTQYAMTKPIPASAILEIVTPFLYKAEILLVVAMAELCFYFYNRFWAVIALTIGGLIYVFL